MEAFKISFEGTLEKTSGVSCYHFSKSTEGTWADPERGDRGSGPPP